MTRLAVRLVCLLLALASAAAATDAGPAPAAAGVRTVYLIRHGAYDEEDRRDPEAGGGLVPLGVAQARLVAARLRGLPVSFSSLSSSTMTRARETAAIVGEELPGLALATSALLSECTPTTWNQAAMADESAADVAACEARLDQAFSLFLAPSPSADRHDLVVAHGNVIRYFVTRALKVDPHAWLGMSIANCSLTVIKVHPDGAMKVLSFGDVGHIPPNLQTRTPAGSAPAPVATLPTPVL